MSISQTSPENAHVLSEAKKWFHKKIIASHLLRTQKLKNPSEFDINPFTTPYLSAFLTGEVTERGIAKALVYPRILGTSISTSFGQNLQSFISDVLVDAFGSIVSGIDIKFLDKLDGREKYAQLKLGPNTINADDVVTINLHFKDIKNLARTNSVQIGTNDLIVCIMYGAESDISNHYKRLRDEFHYPVIVGNDFWHRLTGDEFFFGKLINVISESLNEVNSASLIDSVIDSLASTEEIKRLTVLAKSFKTEQ
jgi:hypothetical protein